MLTPEQENAVRTLFASGVSQAQIVVQTGLTPKVVTNRLREWGLRRTRSEIARRFTINESAFATYTPESLYWAGFIMADGCISPFKNRSTRIEIDLQRKDRDHLVKLACFVGMPAHCIHDYRTSVKSKLTIASTRMAADLLYLGITPAKSKTAAIANDNSDVLYSTDFWRGLIDGDGTLGIYKYNYPVISLASGSPNMLRQYELFLRHHGLPLGCANTRSYSYAIYGRKAYAVIRCLYVNSAPSLSLDRKYRKAMEILSYA